jgi:dihydroorotate dehydrogenase
MHIIIRPVPTSIVHAPLQTHQFGVELAYTISEAVVDKLLTTNEQSGVTPDLNNMEIGNDNSDPFNQADLVKKVKDRDDFISYFIANVTSPKTKREQEQFGS